MTVARPFDPSKPPPPASGRATVLIVDDDPDELWLFRRAFAQTLARLPGVQLETCQGGGAALAWLDRREAAGTGSPELVLIDMNMPGMSGIDLLREMRARRGLSAAALLVVTGSTEPHLVDEARAAGAHAVLAKPDTLHGMRTLAELLLRERTGAPPPDPGLPQAALRRWA